jgi:hypothetical protein
MFNTPSTALRIPLPAYLLLAALVTLSFTSCRGNLYKLVEIRGKVTTCEGKPAVGGKVTFYPIDDPEKSGRPAGNPGRQADGVVAEDGTFTLTTIGMPPAPGVVTGRHRVTFEMPPTRRPVLPADDRATMSPEEAKQVEADFASRPVYPPLPCSDQIEPSEVTVTKAGDQFEFKLAPK